MCPWRHEAGHRLGRRGPAARKILRHLELPDAPPVLAAARVDQDCFWPTGPPDDEGCDPPYVDDVQRSPPDHAA